MMTTVLAIVALLSFGSAAAMAVLLWSALRDERRRSDARVAALASAIAGVDPARRDEKDAGARVTLFDSAAPSAHRGPRLAAALAMGVAAVCAIVSTIVLLSSGRPTASVRARAPSAETVELMALNHERAAGALAIKGVVRNSARGSALNHLTAVAFGFDRNGGFVTSSRAEVDDHVLNPGAETRFTIVIDRPSEIVRYRISFRSGDHIVPHVDRRTLQANTEP